MNDFEIYFRALQAYAKRDGVRVGRAEEYANWKAAATQELIYAVRGYAIAHYQTATPSRDGWDYVVECYSVADIAEIIKGCRTAAGAIAKVRKEVKQRADLRAEMQAEAF